MNIIIILNLFKKYYFYFYFFNSFLFSFSVIVNIITIIVIIIIIIILLLLFIITVLLWAFKIYYSSSQLLTIYYPLIMNWLFLVTVQALWEGLRVTRCAWQSRETHPRQREAVHVQRVWKSFLPALRTQVSHELPHQVVVPLVYFMSTSSDKTSSSGITLFPLGPSRRYLGCFSTHT